MGVEVFDKGKSSLEASTILDFGAAVARAVASGKSSVGSGLRVRHRHIDGCKQNTGRAVRPFAGTKRQRDSRVEHNDANVLCFGSRSSSPSKRREWCGSF